MNNDPKKAPPDLDDEEPADTAQWEERVPRGRGPVEEFCAVCHVELGHAEGCPAR